MYSKTVTRLGAAIIWLALLAVVQVPDAAEQQIESKVLYTGLILGILGYLAFINCLNAGGRVDDDYLQNKSDVLSIIGIIILTWEITVAKLGLGSPIFWIAPAKVLVALYEDLSFLSQSFLSSMKLLLGGYFLALLSAIPLGLWIGWNRRLLLAVYPITKIASPIPPTVLLPYALMIFKTIDQAAMFIIFIGAFWPVLINTLHGVFNVDYRLINSAKSFGISNGKLLLRVLLPGAAPGIFSGAMVGLVLSFIMLTVAEMVGADAGLGYYVSYYADMTEFDKVLAGIIFIGIVVTGVVYIFDKIRHYCLRWQRNSKNIYT
ncbi:ABC transporter permease [Thermoanaerobacterium sp. DL9XJH110]|uniref:ABC transporter permease n=1 Tax=Thermoanaerobacterium sp. DL9XJH110 TaxID=3386643 RepID=UPI003BB76ED3